MKHNLKKTLILPLMCAVLALSGCNGTEKTSTSTTATTAATGTSTTADAQTSTGYVTNAPVEVDGDAVALTIDGSDVSLSSYIFYQIAAKTEAVNAVKKAEPDSAVTAEVIYDYSVEGKTAKEWIKDKTVYFCSQLVNIEKNFDKLGLSLTEQEKTDAQNNIVNFWETADQRIKTFFGFDYNTWGEYYTSLGINRAAYERACYASAMQTSLFNYYYGDNGTEKSSDESIKAFLTENYASCQYFVMQTYSFIPKSEILRLGDEFSAAVEAGTMTVAEAKSEYNYYFKQQSILDDVAMAASAGTEYTGDSVDSVIKTEVSESSVSFILQKGADKPTQAVEEKVFGMEYNKPELFEDGDFFYLIVRSDIMQDSSAVSTYLPYAYHALNDEAFFAKFDSEIKNYPVTVNDELVDSIV